MLGAIIGDIVGSRFEQNPIKTKEFTLFESDCCFTDDTVMTLAVAKAILRSRDLSLLGENAVRYMVELGRRYPDAGYGGRFFRWLFSGDFRPYNSYGNGSAMRVSACGFAAESLEQAIAMADAVTKVTHDHPEGMKGAEATAAAVFLAKTGSTIPEIREHIVRNYYPIDFTLDEIRPDYRFDVTCQGSVPQALEAFFESVSFEDTIRNAVSLGGDCDTQAAIAGGIAEAYYGIPDTIRDQALGYLPDELLEILAEFERA